MTDTPKDPQVAEYINGMRAWRAEFEAVRPVLLRAGLDEDFKWRKPCYTHGGSNVAIFQPFKQLCALLFFNGALLRDPAAVLKEQGENTRSALRLEFRSVADVMAAKKTLTALVQDAISVEQAGLSAPDRAPADDELYPQELATRGGTTRGHNRASGGARVERARRASTRSAQDRRCSTWSHR